MLSLSSSSPLTAKVRVNHSAENDPSRSINGISETGFDWAAFDRVMGDSCDGLLDKYLQEKEKQREGLPRHLHSEEEL
jgi:hypothetical protein